MIKGKYEKYIDYLFVTVYVFLFLGCFISQDVYAVIGRLASLISFVALGFLCVKCKYDKDIFVVIFGMVITAFNLFYVHSNKGAFFTAANLLLMLYVADKISFSRKQKLIMSGVGSSLLLFWYVVVRWDYNFNMAGLVFMITCFSCLLFFELLKDKYPYLQYIQLISYITSLLFCVNYLSRCAAMGLIIFGLIYLVYPLLRKLKWMQALIIIAATMGSVLFTLLYVKISQGGMNLTILYKDVLSGRQDIWAELWQALMEHPLTGVGSAYTLKSFFIFEVHNGLFDILSVHGVVVFVCVLYLLIKKLRVLFININNSDSAENRIVISAVFAMLFTSFFENFFIVSPYLLIMLFLISIPNNTVYDESE